MKLGASPAPLKTNKKMELDEIKINLKQEIAYADDVIDTVMYAIKHKKHCLLWGPPGHAKSMIVENTLKALLGEEKFFEDVVLINGGADMDTSPITGYTNLKVWKDLGIKETVLTETIFAKKKYAVIEEGLDIPPYALLAAKNPLSQGYLCVNNTCLTNTLENLFLCTNHDPRAWARNDAEKAFIDRFDFVVEVKWPAYNPENYDEMFLKQTGSSQRIMSKIAAANTVSPRDAMKMWGLMSAEGDHRILRHFNGMNAEWFAKIEKIVEEQPFYDQLMRLEKILEEVEDAGNFNKLSSAKTLLHFDKIPTDAAFTERVQKARQTYKNLADLAVESISKVTL